MQPLLQKIRDFNAERDWQQFHSPKNLAMALMVEVAELGEHFQWLTEEQSRELRPEQLCEVQDEIGDAVILLLNLADKLGIDPLKAADGKLEKNRRKYPADAARGKADKYHKYAH